MPDLCQRYVGISIHALLAESDCSAGTMATSRGTFLSTLSLRRATTILISCMTLPAHFYPRSPCGERLSRVTVTYTPATISIHALLAESDILLDLTFHKRTNFYPRSPCGERRRHRGNDRRPVNFYPRSPCGERRSCTAEADITLIISIHALLAESDMCHKVDTARVCISIHALLAESDTANNATTKNA